MAIAYGRPRLPAVPELLVHYEVAFAAPGSPRFILQHAIHPSSLHQVDLGSDTRQCLHVCKHSDPCHRQERDNYRMPLNVLRRLVVSVYKRRDKATAMDQLTCDVESAGQQFIPCVGQSELQRDGGRLLVVAGRVIGQD